MTRRSGSRPGAAPLAPALLALLGVLGAHASSADTVPLRFPEGVVRGFLRLSVPGGAHLADGDLIQTARGDRVTSRLVLHFRDGSLHDETVVFTQRDVFRVVSDRLIQKGPSFPRPLDVSVDGLSGRVTVRYTDDGRERSVEERLELPGDLSNGMIFTLLKNIRPETPQTAVSMVAATPKPRLVKLVVTPVGEEPFTVGTSRRKAMRYVVEIKLGGIAGLVAPLIGKQPEDSHVWILGGDAPAFVKSEGPLYAGGPVWRLELACPQF